MTTTFLTEKTAATLSNQNAVEYTVAGQSLNAMIGKPFSLSFTGKTACIACGNTHDELDGGHCPTCQATLAKCDICNIKPELCHFDAGTCRQPDWAAENCMTAHVIYLSNTSGVKIGITREKNIADRSRWIDQGATQALPFLRVSNRLTAGQIEVVIAAVMADKTNWRTMLTGNGESVDLKAIAAELSARFEAEFALYGDRILERLNADVVTLEFPVQAFPAKVGNAWNVKKQPTLSGVLVGVKGQYIMVDVAGKIEVLNLRKYAGYEVTISN